MGNDRTTSPSSFGLNPASNTLNQVTDKHGNNVGATMWEVRVGGLGPRARADARREGAATSLAGIEKCEDARDSPPSFCGEQLRLLRGYQVTFSVSKEGILIYI